jgi:UDP-N-acetylglucosamine--N-acetylmuramyl-(pentapeptide) pyrophosphoryl-undecaprenol N-acetylglucosamine transferase
VRPAFFEAKREEGRQRLGLDAKLPVVLVSGASSGANALNRAVAARALSFVESAQLLHLSGRADEAWLRSEREQLPQELRQRWQIHAYLHEEMPYALAAADLAVIRAGASVLGELAAARLPAVLVPGVYEGHDQTPNARYLEEAGAAVLLPQTRLSDLAAVVLSLLGDKGNLEAMREALARLARPEAAEELAKLVLATAGVAAPPMEAVQP